jgi:hypothetical protein
VFDRTNIQELPIYSWKIHLCSNIDTAQEAGTQFKSCGEVRTYSWLTDGAVQGVDASAEMISSTSEGVPGYRWSGTKSSRE